MINLLVQVKEKGSDKVKILLNNFKDKPTKMYCSVCGKEWNVSVYKKLGKSGYICPVCSNLEKRLQRATLIIFTYLILILVSLSIYCCLDLITNIERGYEAVGGEIFVLFVPIIFLCVSHELLKLPRVVMGIISDIKKA